MEENPRLMLCWQAIVLSPVLVAVMLPLLLALSVMAYVCSIFYVVVEVFRWLGRRRPVLAASPLQDPHFRIAILRKVRRE